MGRAVGAERAGIEFIGIHPVFPDIQHAFRRVPNEIVLVGHRLSQFLEQGEFSPVAGVFGLDIQITLPRRIIEGIELTRFPQEQIHMFLFLCTEGQIIC